MDEDSVENQKNSGGKLSNGRLQTVFRRSKN